jgi:hypothetical protein
MGVKISVQRVYFSRNLTWERRLADDPQDKSAKFCRSLLTAETFPTIWGLKAGRQVVSEWAEQRQLGTKRTFQCLDILAGLICWWGVTHPHLSST